MEIELEKPDEMISVADKLARLCNLAYTPEVKTNLDFEGSCISTGDVQLRLFEDEYNDYGVIAITGSNSFQDFAGYNLNTSVKNYLGMQFHEGFFNYAEVALSAIKALDSDGLLPPCFLQGNFIVTGHSLGAAAAAILPLLMAFKWDQQLPDGVVGFGCPNYCIGDTPALYPVSDCLSINSRWDVVAHLPAGILTKRFSKCGVQYWIDDNGISTDPGHEVLRFASYACNLATFSFLRKRSFSLAEHSCLRYETRTAKAVQVVRQKIEEFQS